MQVLPADHDGLLRGNQRLRHLLPAHDLGRANSRTSAQAATDLQRHQDATAGLSFGQAGLFLSDATLEAAPMSPETFRGTGPAEALGAVIRKFGPPADPSLLGSRFEVHPEPASLLALVQIAGEWGLTARAFQGEIENLSGIPLPAVVHLRAALDGESSFGVLVGIGETGFELESPSGAGTETLPRAAFASAWTGVVVTFARGDRPPAPPREPGAFARWLALTRSDRQAGALVAARAIAVAGATLLALASAGRLAPAFPGAASAAGALVALDLLAAAACVTLFHASRRTRVASATPRLAQRICGRGRLGDCEGVLGSKWARIGGFDLAVLGLGFAGSAVALAAASALAPAPAALAAFAWIGVAHLLAAPASLVFTGLQVYPLRRFCPLCMTVHLCVLGGAALTAPLWLAASSVPHPAVVLASFPVLHLLAFLGVLGLVVPLLELNLETRASRARLGWIAATPWGALAEAAGRAPAFASPPASPFTLGAPGAPFRIDALVHPFCTGCGPVVDGLVALVARRPGAVEVAFHLAPRDPKDPGDRALCAAVSAIGLLAGGEQTVHVFRAIKAEPRRYLEIARESASRLVGRFLAAGVPVEAVLPAAAEAVERAERLADLLRTGTPTLLVNGRVWESTLDDLDRILRDHPAIAAEAFGGLPERNAARERTR